MVLISGNNKSFLQQTNDERPKSQGITMLNNSKVQGVTMLNNSHQQHGNKSTEGGRTQNMVNTSLMKGMTTMDEFKYGFPSEGLSATSNRWWGSSKDDDCAGTNPDRAKSQIEGKTGKEDKAACEAGNAENSETPQGAALLNAVRKRVVEEGREALKLGVYHGYGVNKLGRRDKILLRRIFRSSLPRSWMHDL